MKTGETVKEGGKKAWGEKMHGTVIPATNLTGILFYRSAKNEIKYRGTHSLCIQHLGGVGRIATEI